MNHKSLCEALNSIESKTFLSSEDLNESNSNYAVLLRLLVWNYYNDYDVSFSFISLIKKILKLHYILFSNYFFNKAYNSLISEKKCIEKLFFYSPDIYYTEFLDGQRFSRVIDALIEIINKKYSFIKYSFRKNGMYKYESSKISIRPYIKYSDRKLFSNIYHYSELYSVKFNINKTSLFIDLLIVYLKVVSYKNVFLRLLSNSSHKFGVTACYYNPEQMGMIWACKELKIPTIDIQHGKQGAFQPLYSHMSYIPKDGYRIVPDYFWNWGTRSVSDIMVHSQDRKHHKAIDVGNLWIDFAFNYYSRESPSYISCFEKVILVTLQDHITGVENVLPCHLADQINSNKNFLWILVPHPNYPMSRNSIYKFIDDHENCLNFRKFESSSLYEILHWVDLHITGYSSVVYESLYYNVPSGVWREEGLQIYEKDIKSGVIHDISTHELAASFFRLPKVSDTHKNCYFSKPQVHDIINFFK